jgi:hypothetical protein
MTSRAFEIPQDLLVSSVVEECRITLDQRHLDAAGLSKMLEAAKEASQKFAQEGNVRVEWERIWQIEPVLSPWPAA